MANVEQAYSSEIWNIIDMTKSDPEHHVLVEMNEGKFVEVSPSDEISKSLLCIGLFGCYAVISFVEKNDGTRFTYITHYPALDSSDHTRKLSQLNKEVEIEKHKRARILVLVPQNDHLFEPNSRELIDSFPENLRSQVGVMKYSTRPAQDQGLVVVNVPCATSVRMPTCQFDQTTLQL